jgi:hypothetical protein
LSATGILSDEALHLAQILWDYPHLKGLVGDLDPLQHVMELRQIVARLRQLGQRRTDEIAGQLERADDLLMDD